MSNENNEMYGKLSGKKWGWAYNSGYDDYNNATEGYKMNLEADGKATFSKFIDFIAEDEPDYCWEVYGEGTWTLQKNQVVLKGTIYKEDKETSKVPADQKPGKEVEFRVEYDHPNFHQD
mmetsp:Transcript_5611/g.8489  ORF Transcript_5611/g.8489 Transcript_5611/m.8489 type:complete len:119 (+) Transcript_5611:210-566(+)